MSQESLEGKLQGFANPVEMLRNAPGSQYPFPVPSEFSNWRDEQEALRESAVLFDLSFHMSDIYVQGPDVVRLLSDVGVNSFEGFGRNRAKQLVACNPDGDVIGDAIVFGLEDDTANIVGRPAAPNWVAYNAERGGYAVEVTQDERAPHYRGQRRTFRFQVTGPNANALLEEVVGRNVDDLQFFHMTDLTVVGVPLRGLNHTMARKAGLELVGPYERYDEVRDALVESGKEHGLRLAGSRTYSTMAVASGWFASPTPAIYSGEAMKPYREWLSAGSWEANLSLGGSFVSAEVEDYYQRPWDLGFGRLIKFDHDFIGRSALEALETEPHRRKVWLRWAANDVMRVYRSWLEPGERCKFMELPAAYYATCPFDSVLAGGRLVGLSQYVVYSVNAGGWFSLALIDEEDANDGTELTVVWGEPDGGTAKPAVERHVQTEIRVTVSTTSPAGIG